MVWLVWLCASILFHLLLFSQYWALVALAGALACLGTLLYDMVFPSPPQGLAGQAARKRTALLYSGGLFFTAVAASILLAMKDWVVIDVNMPKLPSREIEEVSLRSTADPLDMPHRQPRNVVLTCQNVVRVVVTKHDFEDIKTWNYLCVILQYENEKKKIVKQPYYLQKEYLSEVIMPGAGTYMQGICKTLKPEQKTPEPTQ